jgi:hypothetical protein
VAKAVPMDAPPEKIIVSRFNDSVFSPGTLAKNEASGGATYKIVGLKNLNEITIKLISINADYPCFIN